jgi:excinuclease UvrABC nuclease subunit
MTQNVLWPLGNDQTLSFEVYDKNKGWYDVPGLYIFTYLTVNGWIALYVGQAQSFQARLPNHERLDEAIRNGATHIHALVVPQQSQRDQWERMLIQNLQPPMNVQHRGLSDVFLNK